VVRALALLTVVMTTAVPAGLQAQDVPRPKPAAKAGATQADTGKAKAGDSKADPASRDEAAKPAPTGSAADGAAAPRSGRPPAAARPRRPVSLEVLATPEAAEPPRIDLFPSGVLQRAAVGDPGTNERRAGVSLGADGGWKAQAAQVGAMVGLFGALAVLCGGGNCAVPDAWTSWLPDALEADPPSVPESRPEPKLREAR
jgi:hypothetical protein